MKRYNGLVLVLMVLIARPLWAQTPLPNPVALEFDHPDGADPTTVCGYSCTDTYKVEVMSAAANTLTLVTLTVPKAQVVVVPAAPTVPLHYRINLAGTPAATLPRGTTSYVATVDASNTAGASGRSPQSPPFYLPPPIPSKVVNPRPVAR